MGNGKHRQGRPLVEVFGYATPPCPVCGFCKIRSGRSRRFHCARQSDADHRYHYKQRKLRRWIKAREDARGGV